MYYFTVDGQLGWIKMDLSDVLRFFALYDIILPCNYQRIIMNIFMMGYMKLKKYKRIAIFINISPLNNFYGIDFD